MKTLWLVSVACLNLLIAAPVLAKPLSDIRADGTWDCKDAGGAYVGAIVLASLSYAFYTPDEKLGAYGDLLLVNQDFLDVPNYVITSGHLKDEMGAVAIALHGPKGHEEDMSGEIIMAIAIDENHLLDCVRREAPGM